MVNRTTVRSVPAVMILFPASAEATTAQVAAVQVQIFKQSLLPELEVVEVEAATMTPLLSRMAPVEPEAEGMVMEAEVERVVPTIL
jgi:hypothetical protein